MKRMNKRIFCTLTLISSTLLPYLTINVKATTDIPRAKTWTEDSGNISNGYNGFMFEDKRGNLWSAGAGTPLQKYDYGTSTWKTSPEISGNLGNGKYGFMFEDRWGNLWSAGAGTPLQRYDYSISTWKTSPAISGNLGNGTGGFMFEDSRGNLWSAGYGTALQKYDYGTSRWKTGADNEITGNLSDGAGGFMFEDSKHNLWSAGNNTPLQKYDYGASTWSWNKKISGNLSNGQFSFMFQDNGSNLWSSGYNAPPQKYNYDTSTWKTSKVIRRNLGSGKYGFMFEDSKHNLWSAEAGTPLQKYDYDNGIWDEGDAISGNISDGTNGFMFQDSKGNLWSAGHGTPLQRYDYTKNKWKTSLAISGNLKDGDGGFMFKDSKGYLWSTGNGSPLQVMYSNKDVASVIALIQANTGMTKIATGEILPILTSSNTPFDANALSSLGTGGTFPTNIRDTTLTYSHEGITSDGALVVTVKIDKGRATAFASFTVVVSGMNLAKVKKEANKFKNFNSPDSLNSAAAILSQNKEDVKTQFEAIAGYNAPSLTDGYSISKIIVKTALILKQKKVVYTVTISDTNSNTATKDIVVTFAVTQDKGLSGGIIAGITIGSILGVGILGFLIYYLFKKLKK